MSGLEQVLLSIASWLGDHSYPTLAGLIGGLLGGEMHDRWRQRRKQRRPDDTSD